MVDAAQLVPGDIILLAIGNVVPADCKLLGSSEDEPLQVSLHVPCSCELSSAQSMLQCSSLLCKAGNVAACVVRQARPLVCSKLTQMRAAV